MHGLIVFNISRLFRFYCFSPRQRSKTPNSSEKVKRSVHFRDEDTLQQSVPAEVDSVNERTGRQDQREIMHSDGKVTPQARNWGDALKNLHVVSDTPLWCNLFKFLSVNLSLSGLVLGSGE